MKIGVLTGGGDCPGLNAVIRAVVRRGELAHGDRFVGYRYGWRGLLDGDSRALDATNTRGILPRGGTILGTSRTNPLEHDDGLTRVRDRMTADAVDALVVIGGEGTLSAAHRLAEMGVAIVGVPKTIDNDISATDYTFGFHTAVQIATDAIDRLHTTAESHDRVMIVEVMGRNAGHIAAYSGMAGGADVVLVPEDPFDIDEVCTLIRRRHENGRNFSIVVVAEGAVPRAGTITVPEPGRDEFGRPRLGGISNAIAPEIEARTGYETRVTILGHLLRGGTPTAFDRIIATRFGIAAIDAVHEGRSDVMVALRGADIEVVPLVEAVGTLKLVDPTLVADARVFFG